MWNNFFKHIDIDPKNAHLLDGNAEDLVKECSNFETMITEAGGVDLFVGGEYLVNNESSNYIVIYL
jgi:glucosamine-6-phosphate deaminase